MSDNRHFILSLREPFGSYASLSDHTDKDVAIVFVHGFAGDAVKTWVQFQLLADSYPAQFQAWQHCDMFFYGYDSTNTGTAIQIHANRLREFLRRIFPCPEPSLVTGPSTEVWKILAETPSDQDLELNYRIRLAERYRHLILVGHSFGGVVVRQMLADLALDHINKSDVTHVDPEADELSAEFLALRADLALFAPANFGAIPSGLSGILLAVALNVTPLRRVLEPFIHSAPVLRDLQPNSPFLSGLRSTTEDASRRCPGFRALRARILYGEGEQLIQLGRYHCDLSAQSVPGHDHVSVCKPNSQYLKPLEFVFDEGYKSIVASSK